MAIGPASANGGAPAGVSIPLAGSVGAGGVNNPADVELVEQRLVGLGFSWLTADGTVTEDTKWVIRLFQSIKNGRQTVGGDGLIEVDQETHKWLMAANAPRWQITPEGQSPSDGFYNVEVTDQTADDHDFATTWMAETVISAGVDYFQTFRQSNPDRALIHVNDFSPSQGGQSNDHSGHQTGLACDVRLPRTDGTAPGGTTIDDPNYDRESMQAMLQSLRNHPLANPIRFFLNDGELIAQGLCHEAPGHHNHLHFEISPPERE